MKLDVYLLLLMISCSLSFCDQGQNTAQPIKEQTEEFKQTWFAGKAELSSYSLQQARYGEIRNGEAVLIFVTEDFSTEKLVKLDEPQHTSAKTKVLKLNMTKKFLTGIYPYSMMLSVFTPVSNEGEEKTLKADCSAQEWCGQTFSQLQLKGSNYNWQLHSYFEKEGEQALALDSVLLEDEIWNRIRLNPSTLPVGKFSVIPGLLWQRLSHQPLQKEEAILSLSLANTTGEIGRSTKIYSIQYLKSERTLKIYFNNFFPHEISGWEETYPDGFGNDKKMMTTKAVRKKLPGLTIGNTMQLLTAVTVIRCN